MFRNELFVDLFNGQSTLLGLSGNFSSRVDQFRARSIIDGKAKRRSGVAGTHFDRAVHLFLDVIRNSISSPNNPDHDVVVHQCTSFLDHVLFEEMHQKVELVRRAFPVFTG